MVYLWGNTLEVNSCRQCDMSERFGRMIEFGVRCSFHPATWGSLKLGQYFRLTRYGMISQSAADLGITYIVVKGRRELGQGSLLWRKYTKTAGVWMPSVINTLRRWGSNSLFCDRGSSYYIRQSVIVPTLLDFFQTSENWFLIFCNTLLNLLLQWHILQKNIKDF